MGARGNSGVILSQLLRGLVAAFPSEGEISAPELADALHHADELARQAVVRPVEGTILSVARAGARVPSRTKTPWSSSLAGLATPRKKHWPKRPISWRS
jgi:dihydroxyacetone kinase-like predicted kinase